MVASSALMVRCCKQGRHGCDQPKTFLFRKDEETCWMIPEVHHHEGELLKSDVYICSSSMDIKVLYGNCFYFLIYPHTRNDGKCFTRFTLEIYCHHLPHCSLQKLEVYKKTILNCRKVNLPWYLPNVLAWDMKNLFLQILEISHTESKSLLGDYLWEFTISAIFLLSRIYRVQELWHGLITSLGRLKWFWTEQFHIF